jgi:hypothetical protein
MGKNSPVVMYRRGFGSSLVLGFFGTFCVVIVCATCVAIYGFKVVNDRLDNLIEMSPAALTALTNWQSALPPAVHDALHDRRMPEYRDKVRVTASLVRDWKTDRLIPIVDVANEGDQIVSLMSLRLQIEDDENLPLQEFTVYAATPLAIESEWRGPLLPGSQRRFRAPQIRDLSPGELSVRWEISELRVWNVAESTPPAATTTDPTADTPINDLTLEEPAQPSDSGDALPPEVTTL